MRKKPTIRTFISAYLRSSESDEVVLIDLVKYGYVENMKKANSALSSYRKKTIKEAGYRAVLSYKKKLGIK